jgi:hypothetical protein
MTRTLLALLFASLASVSIPPLGAQEASLDQPAKIRIGTYDNRAIAVAWAGSDLNPVKEKMKEYEIAKQAKDVEKIAELEAWGPAHQRLLHFQGFGRVPVGELLTPLRDQVKELMAEKRLTAIAMQCDEIADNVELVDITLDLVKLYKPTDQTLEWVEQLRDQPPVSLIELADLPADK